jgi:hypothetical protein
LSCGVWRGPRRFSWGHSEMHCVWREVGGQGEATLGCRIGIGLCKGGMAVGTRWNAQAATIDA